jgi:hypothetical protein
MQLCLWGVSAYSAGGLDVRILCEAAMGLDDLVVWHAGLALQAVDVLREELQ